MKELVEYFKAKGVLFKELYPVDLKSYKIKKRWQVFVGVDQKNRYWLIVRIERKSRFLRKDAQEVLSLQERLEQILGHGFKKRHLILKAPLCSRAEEFLKEAGWSVDAVM